MEVEPHAPERLLAKLRPSQGDAGPQQAGGRHQPAEQHPPAQWTSARGGSDSMRPWRERAGRLGCPSQGQEH